MMHATLSQPMPIFVINLRQDREKREHMEALSQRLGLDFTFVDAIYGKDLSQEEVDALCDRERSLRELKRELFRGEIGCALSHMTIYRKMVREEIPVALILEDDADLCERITEIMGAVDNFPDDWELLLLGYHLHFPGNRKHRLSFWGKQRVSSNFRTVRFSEMMHGTIGYIINLQGGHRLLETLEKGIYKPIDHYTGDEREVNLYGLEPQCVQVNPVLHRASNIRQERVEYYYKNVGQKHQEKILTNSIKEYLAKLGMLKAITRINALRGKFFYEMKSLIKRLRRPVSYLKIEKGYRK